jgi:hypothetical protein
MRQTFTWCMTSPPTLLRCRTGGAGSDVKLLGLRIRFPSPTRRYDRSPAQQHTRYASRPVYPTGRTIGLCGRRPHDVRYRLLVLREESFRFHDRHLGSIRFDNVLGNALPLIGLCRQCGWSDWKRFTLALHGGSRLYGRSHLSHSQCNCETHSRIAIKQRQENR